MESYSGISIYIEDLNEEIEISDVDGNFVYISTTEDAAAVIKYMQAFIERIETNFNQ